jgi:AcrR family transcriptional regulator
MRAASRMKANRAGYLRKRRRTQAERSAETRRRLIDSTIQFICENGFAAMTTTLVASRAGVSRGALQHQFGTRYDLLAAVVDHLSAEITARTATLAAVLSDRNPELARRVETALRAYWDIYTSDIFIAVVNIFLGLRNHADQYRPLQQRMIGIRQEHDAMWLRLLADSPLPRSQLLAARRVLFGAMRGLAIAQLFGQRTSLQSEMQIIRDMLLAVLAPGGGVTAQPA